jgi:hypothetical protein
MPGDPDAVKWLSRFCLAQIIPLRESCHAKRLSFVHRLSPADPKCPTFRRRRKTVSRQIDTIGLRSNRPETILNQAVRGESNHLRDTIHLHPEWLRSSLSLDPNEIKIHIAIKSAELTALLGMKVESPHLGAIFALKSSLNNSTIEIYIPFCAAGCYLFHGGVIAFDLYQNGAL